MWYRSEVLRTVREPYLHIRAQQIIPVYPRSHSILRNKQDMMCMCQQHTTPHHTTRHSKLHHTTQQTAPHRITQQNKTNYTTPHQTINYTTPHNTTQTIDYVTHTNPIEIQILTFIYIRHGHRTHHMTSCIPTWSLSVSSADLWASFPSLTRSSRLENWDWLTIEIEWHK